MRKYGKLFIFSTELNKNLATICVPCLVGNHQATKLGVCTKQITIWTTLGLIKWGEKGN